MIRETYGIAGHATDTGPAPKSILMTSPPCDAVWDGAPVVEQVKGVPVCKVKELAGVCHLHEEHRDVSYHQGVRNPRLESRRVWILVSQGEHRIKW